MFSAFVSVVRSWFRFIFLSLALFALAPPPAARAAACECDEYLSFLPQYQMIDQVSAIGVSALHPEGNQLGASAELAAAMRLKVESDARIPARCRDYVASRIRMAPMISAVGRIGYGGPDPKFTMDSAKPDGLVNAYDGMYASYLTACSKPGSDVGTAAAGGNAGAKATIAAYGDCLKKNGPDAYSRFSARMSGRNGQLKNDLAGLGQTVTTDDVKIIKAYHDVLNAGSEKALMDLVRAKKDGLNTDQFLTLVQMLGARMNKDYDLARAAGGPRGDGIVNGDTLISAMKTNTIYRIGSDRDIGMAVADYEGVCRDIAVLQARMLDARGFPNTFIVAYKDAGGGHADVVTGDPGNPRRVNVLNYSGRSSRDGLDGAVALFQGSGYNIHDTTLNYRLFKPSGQQIMSVPSEMGKFLAEASGFDIRTLDPLARTKGSLFAIEVSPDPQGRFQARFFHGTDGNGAEYTGVSTDVRWGEGSHFPGALGVAGALQVRPSAAYGTADNGSAIVGYAQLEQHVVSSPIPLSPNANLTLDGSVTVVTAMVALNSGPGADSKDNGIQFQSDHRVGVEARVDQRVGPLRIRYRAGFTLQGGFLDVRDESVKNFTIVPLHGYAGVDASVKVGDTILIGDALVVVDALGARGRLEVGVASGAISFTGHVAGRLVNGTALLQDQSVRRAGLNLAVAPNKHLKLGVSGEMPIEGDSPQKGVRVQGMLNVSY